MAQLSGFMVVRLPEFAEQSYFRKTPTLEGKVYRGIDRLPWDTTDNPQASALELVRAKIEHGFYGVRNLSIAEKLDDALEFEKVSADARNELIAVDTDNFCGASKLVADIELEFLGYEVCGLGEWSLHRAILFTPDCFPNFVKAFNKHSLFDEPDLCAELSDQYIALSKDGRCEPLADDPFFVQLKVYQVVGV